LFGKLVTLLIPLKIVLLFIQILQCYPRVPYDTRGIAHMGFRFVLISKTLDDLK